MKQFIGIFLISLLFVNCGPSQELKSITTIQLKTLLSKGKLQLVDVRTPKEIDKGSIKTAIFVNYFDADFAIKIAKNLNKNKPVYLYCRSGNRSGKAAVILKEKGFEVYNVLGGYNQWKIEN